MKTLNNSTVLVTGITGFVGSHTAIQLLKKGYNVIGTLRDASRANSIRNMIEKQYSGAQTLRFVEADLTRELEWKEVTQGVEYIQHIASPFPRELPKHEDDLIIPARNGTLHILKAASENGVKRVVLTSSLAAIVYGKQKNERNALFNENHWSDSTNKRDNTPYFRSKTIAEKTAWDFVRNNKSGPELVTVCPGAILGPVMEQDFGTSANMVIKLLDGSTPGLPDIGFDIVDVRSTADLLIRAMELPQAANQRYAASAGYLKFKDVAQILKAAYPKRKIPTATIPDLFVRLFSNFDKTLKPILIDLGVERKLKSDKARKELGWNPFSSREAVLSCAESVIELGIVK